MDVNCKYLAGQISQRLSALASGAITQLAASKDSRSIQRTRRSADVASNAMTSQLAHQLASIRLSDSGTEFPRELTRSRRIVSPYAAKM